MGLVLIGLLSGVWVLAGQVVFPGARAFPNTPATTLVFLAAAVATTAKIPARYQWSTVAGLGFSSVGDAFLMQPRDYFVAGLGSFLAAHLCYLWALTYDTRLAGHKLPFVVWGLVGVGLLSWLWPGVPGPLRIPTALYTAALLAMAAQAANRALSRRDVAAIVAAIGATFFVVSDSALAIRRFGHPFEWGRVIVLGTYFAAQAGLALSVVLHRSQPPRIGLDPAFGESNS